jgi:transposase-like protein/ribosomal protein L37AE/L43A
MRLPATLEEFQAEFASEEACRAYLFASRWPDGFVCPRCGCGQAGPEQRRHLWQCRRCGHQTSVTAGTVMHRTHTPLTLWFGAAYLVATHSNGVSALQLKRDLGISRYETAWQILHRLRRAMAASGDEPLAGGVEVDVAFVGRGRTLVGVAVEMRGDGLGRVRLRVVPDASAASLGPFVADVVLRGTTVHSNGWRGYAGLRAAGFDHRVHMYTMPRSRRVIADLKRWLGGTHHGVSAEHLHVYLDEFAFRHNHRDAPAAAFDTLITSQVSPARAEPTG